MKQDFTSRLKTLQERYQRLITRGNVPEESLNGIYYRYRFPVLTAEHTPLFWRYDLNESSNPHLLERFGINSVFNAGAVKLRNKYLLVARVEGNDRKSFFAVAESDNGVDNFRFWDEPVVMPETDDPDINVYDMRIVEHEDGWIYGLFCTERKDKNADSANESAAVRLVHPSAERRHQSRF